MSAASDAPRGGEESATLLDQEEAERGWPVKARKRVRWTDTRRGLLTEK